MSNLITINRELAQAIFGDPISAIYHLMDSGEVVYVGKTTNLLSRKIENLKNTTK